MVHISPTFCINAIYFELFLRWWKLFWRDFLEALWVCLLESSPGNEACLSWAPVHSHTNELLIRMMKLLGEVKPSSWPKRRLWINLCKAKGWTKTAAQHSGANETCMSATEELKVWPVVFVERSKVGAHSSMAFSAFIPTAADWNWECSAAYSIQWYKAVFALCG